MSFINLKAKIKEKLEAIDEIQEVKDFPQQDFNGYPSVNIRTTGNTSDYLSTEYNTEVYSFEVIAFQELNSALHTREQAREIIERLCDTIRDAFDKDEFLDGVILPANRAFMALRPTVSEIGEEESGKYVVAIIEMACLVTKNINT